MINLDFDVSKINILVYSIEQNKAIEMNPDRMKYPIECAKENAFLKLINDRERLRQILSPDEINACQTALFQKSFKGETFFEVLHKGYEIINDENYVEVFNRCVREYGTVKETSEFANEFLKSIPALTSAMNKLMFTEEFESLYNDTCKYRDELEKNWNDNKEYISSFVENVFGKKIDTNSKVWVQPPIFDEGYTSKDNNKDIILSRCHDNIRNNHDIKELVFLTHESMHSQVLPYIEKQDGDFRRKLHSFIQYLCDNELCSRILEQRGGTYRYEKNKHHGIDNDVFDNMYPYFIGYLYRNEENPVECIANNMRRNTEFSARIDENGNNKQLYSPIAIANFFRGKKNMSPYEFAELDFSKARENFGVKERHNEGHKKDTSISR